MAWKYSKEEAAKDPFKAWDAGMYPGKLQSVKDSKSKAGADMLVLTWIVKHPGTLEKKEVMDYWTGNFGYQKAENLAAVMGLSHKIENETFNPRDYIGTVVGVELEIQPARRVTQDDGTVKEYRPSNAIKGYGETPTSAPEPAPPVDEELPF